MAIHAKTELVVDHRFDPKSCRHLMNGEPSVLHCHHYASLYTQLADDCGMLDAKKLLTEVSEDTFHTVLADYYQKHGITSVEDRISIAEQYFSTVTGLGMMKVKSAGSDSGEVEMAKSHVDQGWVKKWGTRDEPVNFIGAGYIAAAFAAVYDKPVRSFSVTEMSSIVRGDKTSQFSVVAN